MSQGGVWRELSDTRLLQDQTATLTHTGRLPPGTRALAGSVIVRPDAYHVRSLTGHMRATTSDASKRMYAQALAEIGAVGLRALPRTSSAAVASAAGA